MKKVFSILMVAMFATAMFSCSKDAEDLIIGTWEETEATYNQTINGEAQDPISMLEPGETVTITFKDDEGNVISSGEYTYGEYVDDPYPEKTSTEQYEYEFTGW
jgi:hypothetical protein